MEIASAGVNCGARMSCKKTCSLERLEVKCNGKSKLRSESWSSNVMENNMLWSDSWRSNVMEKRWNEFWTLNVMEKRVLERLQEVKCHGNDKRWSELWSLNVMEIFGSGATPGGQMSWNK